MQTIAEGKALNTNYSIAVISGTVSDTQTRTETETTGQISGGQGYSVGGTGSNSAVSGKIESKTTRFQDIFLTDDEGQEHAIKLVNFLVPCKEGHRISLYQLKAGGDGTYFHAYNHNTREHCENDGAASKAVFPTYIFAAAVAVLGFLIYRSAASDPSLDGFETLAMTFIATGLGGLVLYAAARIVASIKAGQVKRNPDYKQHLTSLAQST